MPNESLTNKKILTLAQWKKLRGTLHDAKEHALYFKTGLSSVSDYFLFNLAWNSGLRIAEVSDLEWQDFASDYIHVRCGKGGKGRDIYFGPKTDKLISDYRTFMTSVGTPCAPGKPVFLNVRSQRLGVSGIHRRTINWFAKAGLPSELTFHSLRHGFATRMLNEGVLLPDLQKALGHSSLAGTSVYLPFTEQAREKFRSLL